MKDYRTARHTTTRNEDHCVPVARNQSPAGALRQCLRNSTRSISFAPSA
uniref:Uncharacterized protein n=1 Tax=Anopheles funestus TaxID=62324 RepID=A0A4Y0BHS6_ANOFN